MATVSTQPADPRFAYFEEQLQIVEELPATGERSWKIQTIVSKIWRLMATSGPAPQQFLQKLVDILNIEGAFTIAQLIIPAFRMDSINLSDFSPAQRQILELTATMRIEANGQPTSQHEYDDDLYTEEKDLFMSAEIQRFCVLLLGTGNPSHRQREEVKLWLQARPKIEKKPSRNSVVVINLEESDLRSEDPQASSFDD